MPLLPEDVKRPVAADGEEPFGEVGINPGAVLKTELQEGVLNHVAGPVAVADQAARVGGERAFETVDGRADPRVIRRGWADSP